MTTDQPPSLFIGSSTEGFDVAREIELQLQNDAITTIWKNDVFNLGMSPLESLMNSLDQFDFAVMILSPDDFLESRDDSYSSPRDNVIFELGLFMGRLGRSRTFILIESGAGIKLPSDLLGIILAPYRIRSDLAAALSPTCTLIIKAIRSLGYSEHRAQRHLQALSNEQQNQKIVIEEHQKFFDIVQYSASDYCYRILWHIANGKEFFYDHTDPHLPRQVAFLYDSGYIEPMMAKSHLLFDMELHRKDLSKFAKPTPIGMYLLELRGEP